MHLAHHGRQTPMAQPFLHHQEHGFASFGAAGLGDDDPIWMQSDRCQSGCKQIGPVDHPQHCAFHSCRHSRHEQAGSCAMLHLWAGCGNFMQAAKTESTSRQMTVDCIKTE
jgi:hypothetical protein